MEDIVLKLNGIEFKGIELLRYKVYPWKSKKEKNKFYTNLLDNISKDNQQKYLQFAKSEFKELIHVNLSRYYIAKLTSIVLLVLGCLVGLSCFLCTSEITYTILGYSFSYVPEITYIILGGSLLKYFLGLFFSKKADAYYNAFIYADLIVDLMFKMEQDVNE